jgi:hypothetical protein
MSTPCLSVYYFRSLRTFSGFPMIFIDATDRPVAAESITTAICRDHGVNQPHDIVNGLFPPITMGAGLGAKMGGSMTLLGEVVALYILHSISADIAALIRF